jgi:hypothetical protein
MLGLLGGAAVQHKDDQRVVHRYCAWAIDNAPGVADNELVLDLHRRIIRYGDFGSTDYRRSLPPWCFRGPCTTSLARSNP